MVCRFVSGVPSRHINNFPESRRGLGHVTLTIFGSTVGYPSDSLASCCNMATPLRLLIFRILPQNLSFANCSTFSTRSLRRNNFSGIKTAYRNVHTRGVSDGYRVGLYAGVGLCVVGGVTAFSYCRSTPVSAAKSSSLGDSAKPTRMVGSTELSYHVYQARYLDGQIWALKAGSLTSPLIVTVAVTVTDELFRGVNPQPSDKFQSWIGLYL